MDYATLVEDRDRLSPLSGQRPLDNEVKILIEKAANAVRVLSIDAVQKANSGHHGLPMGCAEMGAYLYGYALKHYPKDPHWINRDRFVLSAGHGSMFLYSLLHLAGFELTLEDIKSFRKLHSKIPGHPESLDTVGVETITCPMVSSPSKCVWASILTLRFLSYSTVYR